jgi:hypothetical protein
LYIISRLIGGLSIALASYIFLHAYRLLNLQQEFLSTQLHQPLPTPLRIFGGCAALIFAFGFLGAGLRFIVKPLRADQNVPGTPPSRFRY